MGYELMENNKVFLKGIVVSEPKFSHEVHGEGFYEVNLSIKRLSDNFDIVPVTVSEKLLGDGTFDINKTVSIKGQFRSYNKMEGEKYRLILTVFVREIIEMEDDMNPNIIEISGFVCKEPVYRITPFKREICDMLVAVNRAYNKSDYLPCIAWGRNARYTRDLKVGEKVSILGRIQSREYEKKLQNDERLIKTAYEISVSKIQVEGRGEVPLHNDKEKDATASENMVGA